jgi:hypothetical protein
MLPRIASAVFSLHIFASATENAWLVVAAVVWAAPACEGSSLACLVPLLVLRIAPVALHKPSNGSDRRIRRWGHHYSG